MKKNIIKKILFEKILLVSLFLYPILGASQEIVKYKNDTLIMITPNNLKTINSIIVDRDFLEKELNLSNQIKFQKDSIIKLKTKELTIKDSIIDSFNNIVFLKDEQIENIRVENKKEKRKKISVGIGSGVLGLLLGLLIVR